MKKLLGLIVIVIIFSSCGTSYRGVSGGSGCGVWFPRKFEKDRSYQRRWNWVNNPNSGRYRSGF
jgi:hypothetical protein